MTSKAVQYETFSTVVRDTNTSRILEHEKSPLYEPYSHNLQLKLIRNFNDVQLGKIQLLPVLQFKAKHVYHIMLRKLEVIYFTA
jgi:hypothetical protein